MLANMSVPVDRPPRTGGLRPRTQPAKAGCEQRLKKHAKPQRRNTFQFFDADLAAHRLEQHTLETALRAAVKENALRLHYQPVIRLSDNAVVGAEALLRWH